MSAVALLCLMGRVGSAQQAPEDRMRDALRQAVTEMRAAQDQAAQAQADLAKAQAEKAALQTQLDAALARPAAPAAPPPDTGLQDRLRAAEAQSAQYQQLSARLQTSYQSATQQARVKDDETRAATAEVASRGAALELCKSTNTKLIDVAEQILHLYSTQSFRAVWLHSYEPLIGTARVKLENLVQDYDDKIEDQAYVPATPRPH